MTALGAPHTWRDLAQQRLQAYALRAVEIVRRIPPLKWLLLTPLIARPGYLFATAVGYTWGAIVSTGAITETGKTATHRGVILASGCPNWAFARGGNTIGAVYITRDNVSEGTLEHEAVHREQWRRYGMAMAVLYIAEGKNPHTNRFEIEAGLENGNYA